MRAIVLKLGLLAFACSTGACSLVTVQQDPFPPLQIRAERPKAPPPKVVLTDSNIQINDKVQFELGSDKLLPVSFPLLDAVAQVMVENPQIEIIEVAGHTDASGGAARNRELSRQRAESVRQYLISKSIGKGRLQAKGYGPDKPVAGNDTPEGREANRRVEFVIVKQGPKKTLVQED
ncbi:MAG TPA: OmpA family protein [Kofleriaceae bacterium]|nr:OmpA family protein [Kofleriaceae bacterium]